MVDSRFITISYRWNRDKKQAGMTEAMKLCFVSFLLLSMEEVAALEGRTLSSGNFFL
jgi:hypothetical protein